MKNSGKTASGESGSCFVEWMVWVVEVMERNVTEGTDEMSRFALHFICPAVTFPPGAMVV
jgi:hypothetical protein